MRLAVLCWALFGCGVAVLGAGVVLGNLWPGVVLMALSLACGLGVAADERSAREDAEEAADSMKAGLAALEAASKKLQSEVEELNRREALRSF